MNHPEFNTINDVLIYASRFEKLMGYRPRAIAISSGEFFNLAVDIRRYAHSWTKKLDVGHLKIDGIDIVEIPMDSA